MKKTKFQEKGQALIIIALATVVLFGFSALAIDGSRVFSDRRNAQNAADTAVLAAALAKVRGNDYTAAAVTRATSNGYTNGTNGATVVVNLCSDSGVTCLGLPAGATASEYIKVKITSIVPMTFAKVLGWKTIPNTVEAIAHATTSSSSSSSGYSGYGLTTLKNSGTGISFTGSGPVNIQGGVGTNAGFQSTGSGNFSVTGNVQVSGALSHTGSGNWNVGGNVWVNGYSKTGSQDWTIGGAFYSDGTFSQTGSGDLTAGSFTTVGNATNTGSGTVAPWPRTVGTYQTPPVLPDPYATTLNPPANPGGCVTISYTGSTAHTINPGCYNSISQTGSGSLTLTPGLYYIIGNFSMTGSGNLTANGVTIYMQGGSLSMTGSGTLTISPPTSGTYKGLSLYMDRSNSNAVSMTGSGASSFTGTIYAPASSYTATGSGGTFVIDSQVICYDSTLTGSGGLNLIYTPANNYNPTPPTTPAIELTK